MDKRTNDKILKRLLGPADPELLCDGCFEKLDQYVELEFRGREADARIPGMRAHLEGCPACHEDYESLRGFIQSGAPNDNLGVGKPTPYLLAALQSGLELRSWPRDPNRTSRPG